MYLLRTMELLSLYKMLQFLTILLIIFTAKGTNGQPENRIVGGTQAPEGRVPYQASLQIYIPGPWHKCGGSIISSEWIMTAGHCINPKDSLDITKIRVGTNNRVSGGVVYDVKRIVVHPQYEGLLNDIALLQVSKPIEFTNRIRPIGIPEKDTQGGANIMITGWGRIDGNRTPDKLQMLNVTALSHEDCLKKNHNIRKSELCTLGGRGKGVCPGDSGGPLVEGNAVVGIVSFLLNGCGYGLPDGSTRVFYYRDWILNTIS